MAEANGSGVKKLHIAGVEVAFPFSPYPSQIAVMSKVIAACEKKECALLESPTGSGKTLALLCSSAGPLATWFLFSISRSLLPSLIILFVITAGRKEAAHLIVRRS